MKLSLKNVIIGGAVALLLVVGISVFTSYSSNSGAARALPNHFELSERILFKWKTSLDVKGDGHNLGNVSERVISLTRSFVLEDNTGAKTATGSVALVSWGTQIDVNDGSGNRIGTIKEEVLSSLFKTWTTYRILDANGNQIAESHKTEWIDTDITLNAPDGKVVAKLHRGWFTKFGDSWTVDVTDPRVDPRLAVMIAAFKTAADNDKSHSGSSSSDKSSGTKK
jgi:uncharacterized protein YxjI